MEPVDLLNLVVIFLPQMTLLRWLTFLQGSYSHSPSLLNLFLSSHVVSYSIMAFPPLGNSGPVVVSVSIDFPSN